MLTENLDSFFDTDDFATPIQIVGSGYDITCNALVDYRYDDIMAAVEGRRITARIISDRAPWVQRYHSVTIDGRSYQITQVEPLFDGKTTNLLLMEV